MTLTFKNTAMALVALLWLAACGGAPNESAAVYDGAPEIVQGYLKVKDALVVSDLRAAQQAAAELADRTETTNQPVAARHARALSGAADLATQREIFQQLSAEVYRVVKDYQPGEAPTLYKQFCPMAFDDQGGYWLSAEKDIRNPYFGDKMLRCGEVQEQI